jgi:hypothetical protein
MDIFGPVDSIYADEAAEHPTQFTEAHLGVTAKMHHTRADGSKLHEASLRERRQTKSTEPFRLGRARRLCAGRQPTLARFDVIRQTTAAHQMNTRRPANISSAGGAFHVIVASISAM